MQSNTIVIIIKNQFYTVIQLLKILHVNQKKRGKKYPNSISTKFEKVKLCVDLEIL